MLHMLVVMLLIIHMILYFELVAEQFGIRRARY